MVENEEKRQERESLKNRLINQITTARLDLTEPHPSTLKPTTPVTPDDGRSLLFGGLMRQSTTQFNFCQFASMRITTTGESPGMPLIKLSNHSLTERRSNTADI